MSLMPENNIPWELISSALLNELSVEDDARLQDWLSADSGNLAVFNDLKNVWNSELHDFEIYNRIDTNIGWQSLQVQIIKSEKPDEHIPEIVSGDFRQRKTIILRWVSIAAIFVVVAGLYLWFNGSQKESVTVYKTSSTEQQLIPLPDGSTIRLYPDSRIDFPKNFNDPQRMVTFVTGKAFFNIKHDERYPFMVDMGIATVKDIGTSFYILQSKDSIKVSVEEGEVAFTEKKENQIRLLSAGMSLKFNGSENNASDAIVIDSGMVNKQNLLHFEKTSLREVVQRLEDVYNVKIVISDSLIAAKRFTASLEGQPINGALEILSKSLNVKYFKKNDVYYLTEK